MAKIKNFNRNIIKKSVFRIICDSVLKPLKMFFVCCCSTVACYVDILIWFHYHSKENKLN